MPVQRSNGRDDQAGLAGSPLARLTEDPFSDTARRRPPCGTAPRAQLERNRSGRPSTDLREQVVDPHNVFTRDLDLPRGHERERVFVRGHSYELRGAAGRGTAGNTKSTVSRCRRSERDRPGALGASRRQKACGN